MQLHSAAQMHRNEPKSTSNDKRPGMHLQKGEPGNEAPGSSRSLLQGNRPGLICAEEDLATDTPPKRAG